MGGFRRTYGNERGELLTIGGDGPTPALCVSASPLYSDEERRQMSLEALGRGQRCIEEHVPSCPTGRRVRKIEKRPPKRSKRMDWIQAQEN
jgi:hypothetical protein